MKRVVAVILVVGFLAGGLGLTGPALLAQTCDSPSVSSHPPRPTGVLRSSSFFSPTTLGAVTDAQGVAPKAVLIVGPIDGDDGPWTTQEKVNMELAADVLVAYGVAVHRFYTPDNSWEEIKAAADGARFLLYRGHGVFWNDVPDVGGFRLKDRFVAPSEIAELTLAPDAIVMLYGCYTAGTSSSDTGDIGITEAQRRVLQYSTPFFEAGARAYYANWFYDGFAAPLENLLSGQTAGQAYESYREFDPNTVARVDSPLYPGDVLWLDKDYWDGFWKYDNAFVGSPDLSLRESALGGIPDRLSFVYSIEEGQWLMDSYTVTPQNVGSALPLPWTVIADTSAVDLSATQGTTPLDTFSVTP
ncbi:MAG: hypothetical protein ACP5HS_11510, partial [Anaerolineae bacterium]